MGGAEAGAERLSTYRDIIGDCVHCGFCLPACPTYVSWGDEMDSPRGRIDLMKGVSDGVIALDAAVIAHFDACLGCMACVTACPSGVQYDRLIESTRATVETAARRSPLDRLFRTLIFALMPYPARLRVSALPLVAYAKSGLQRLVRRSGLLRALPLRLAQLDALLPPLTFADLRRDVPDFTAARNGRVRARVGLVAGCVQRAFFPNVNAATVRVLSAEGCDVSVPPGQGCCGALSLHTGRLDEAKRFARALIDRFANAPVDTIVINAAGCGSTLKEYGELLAAEPAYAERARAFSARVRDVSEFLVTLEPQAPRGRLERRVAYHDACHLAHAQRVREAPRALLRSIPGLELLEIPHGDMCCGSAGTYNLLQPASAREIGERKAEAVASVGADLLASANPGCTLQIASIMRERGTVLPAAHPVEILDRAISSACGGATIPRSPST
jgi:glycolate oxidase iron-sulfur subunit